MESPPVVAEAGFDGVEFDAGMPDRLKAVDLRKMMANLDLGVIGLTILMSQLDSDLDRYIEYAQTIGAEWIVSPGLTLS